MKWFSGISLLLLSMVLFLAVPIVTMAQDAPDPADPDAIKKIELGSVLRQPGDKWVFAGQIGDLLSIAVDDHGILPSTLKVYGPLGQQLALGASGDGAEEPATFSYRLPRSGIYNVVLSGDKDSADPVALTLQRAVSSSLIVGAGTTSAMLPGIQHAVSTEFSPAAVDNWTINTTIDDAVQLGVAVPSGEVTVAADLDQAWQMLWDLLASD